MFTAELLKRRKLLADFGRVLLHAHPDDDGNVPQPCGFRPNPDFAAAGNSRNARFDRSIRDYGFAFRFRRRVISDLLMIWRTVSTVRQHCLDIDALRNTQSIFQLNA